MVDIGSGCTGWEGGRKGKGLRLHGRGGEVTLCCQDR